jgi:hypothetical protein
MWDPGLSNIPAASGRVKVGLGVTEKTQVWEKSPITACGIRRGCAEGSSSYRASATMAAKVG